MSGHLELTVLGVPRRRGSSRLGLRKRRQWAPTFQKMREMVRETDLWSSLSRRSNRHPDHSGIHILFSDLPRDMLFASVRDAKLFVAGEISLKDVVERFENREDLAEVYRAVALRRKCLPFGVHWNGETPYYATLTTHPSKHLV